jgi:hypothetical protein
MRWFTIEYFCELFVGDRFKSRPLPCRTGKEYGGKQGKLIVTNDEACPEFSKDLTVAFYIIVCSWGGGGVRNSI